MIGSSARARARPMRTTKRSPKNLRRTWQALLDYQRPSGSGAPLPQVRPRDRSTVSNSPYHVPDSTSTASIGYSSSPGATRTCHESRSVSGFPLLTIRLRLRDPSPQQPPTLRPRDSRIPAEPLMRAHLRRVRTKVATRRRGCRSTYWCKGIFRTGQLGSLCAAGAAAEAPLGLTAGRTTAFIPRSIARPGSAIGTPFRSAWFLHPHAPRDRRLVDRRVAPRRSAHRRESATAAQVDRRPMSGLETASTPRCSRPTPA